MSRTQNTIRNLSWGMIYRIIGTLVPFFRRTIVIYSLGALYLGLNGLFTSVLSVLSLSELGISSAIVFHMYKPIAENDTHKVCALLNLYRKCYQIIGLIVAVLGLSILPFISMLIHGETPVDVNIYILYIIQLVGTVLSYELFAYKVSLLNALQRNDIVSKLNGVCLFGQFIAQSIILIVWKNYYLFLIAETISKLANNILAEYISTKKYPQFKCEGVVNTEIKEDIKTKVKGMILQKIGNVVLFSADSIVISAFLGLRQLAIYQNYYLVFTAVGGFLGIIQTALIPSIGNSIATESVEKNYKDFKKFNFLYVWITAWCTICMMCLYQPFMKIWVGESMMLSNSLMLLFTAYFFIFMWQNMNYIYEEACGLFFETRWIPVVAAFVNLTINIFLVKRIGLAGVLLSTILVAVFVYHIGFITTLFKYYFKSADKIHNYFIRQWSYLIAILVASIVSILICRSLSLEGYCLLGTRLLICLIIPNMLLIIFWKHRCEYKDAEKWIINYINERKGT